MAMLEVLYNAATRRANGGNGMIAIIVAKVEVTVEKRLVREKRRHQIVVGTEMANTIIEAECKVQWRRKIRAPIIGSTPKIHGQPAEICNSCTGWFQTLGLGLFPKSFQSTI